MKTEDRKRFSANRLGLDYIASFMSIPRIDEESLRKTNVYEVLDFLGIPRRRYGPSQLRSLQEELRSYILPIVEPDGDSDDMEVHLRRLLDRINQVGFKPRWRLRSGLTTFPAGIKRETIDADGTVSTTFLDVKNAALSRLGPDHRIVKLRDTKWIIERDLFVHDLAGQFYGRIALSLEDGSFSRLKICPECKRFFLAEPREKFCNRVCMQTFHDRKAPERAASSRRMRRESDAKSIERGVRSLAPRQLDQLQKRLCAARTANDLVDVEEIKTGKVRVAGLPARVRKAIREYLEERSRADGRQARTR